MSAIEVFAPDIKPESIPVNQEPINYAEAAARYMLEAEDPSLPKFVREAKINTANFLQEQANNEAYSDLQEKVQEYLGNKTIQKIGKNAIHHS